MDYKEEELLRLPNGELVLGKNGRVLKKRSKHRRPRPTTVKDEED
jgi:hypothetical protein